MNNLTVSRRRNGLKVISSDGKTWTVELNFGVYQILSASNRRIKAAGPTGKRIVAAVDEFFAQCAEQLPAALDQYVQALNGSDADARTSAWRRCEQLGASYNDYILARRRAEQEAA